MSMYDLVNNRDMRDPVSDFFPEIKLLITDAPNLPWMPKDEIEKGLNQYTRFIRFGIVCFDDPLHLRFPSVQYSHEYYAKHFTHLLYTAIYKYTEPGDIVFDPFCGYSTAGICALNLGRRYIGYEVNLDIYKISKKRLQDGLLFQ